MKTLEALLPFILIIAVFWLLLIRPQQRRQQSLRALQSSLQVGSEVMLTSGIFGTVKETNDDHILVEIAPGMTVKVVRAAIANVIPQADPDGEASDSADAATEDPDTEDPDTGDSDTDDTDDTDEGESADKTAGTEAN